MLKRIFILVAVLSLIAVSFYGTARAEVLFQEDFNDGNCDGWDVYVESNMSGPNFFEATADKTLKITIDSTANTNYMLLMYTGGLDLPDSYQLTYRARLLASGYSQFPYGSDILAVYLNLTTAYSYSLITGWRQNEYNDYGLWEYANGYLQAGQKGLIGWDAYNFDEFSWHIVKIIKNGASIDLYLNDALLFSEPLVLNQSGGSFGFYLTHGIYEIDDILITSGGGADDDADGFESDVDCNDNDSSTYPGAPELCDGKDNDCDGITPENEADADGDGYLACADCDDTNPEVNKNAFEIPGNFVDENCDGDIGECDPCYDWKNHGQYVRCVAAAVGDLFNQGLLTEEEGDALVSSAAKSDIGKKGYVPPECQ